MDTYRLFPRHFLIIVWFFAFSSVNAQGKAGFKFGKIGPEDFSVPVSRDDSGAHALIISDVGKSVITPNKTGGFGYEFERKLRVKIMDANGIDAGKFEINLFANKEGDSKENLTALKGFTYNLENGKIVTTSLGNDQVYSEKTGKRHQTKKFSLPALKAGAIFELSYTIQSDFLFELRSWNFQHEYPCTWSEYVTEIPGYYDYIFLAQGYHPFAVNTNKVVSKNFLIRNSMGLQGGMNDTYTIIGLVNVNRWAMKDIPALKDEGYTTTLENYRSKIDFQLSSINYPGQDPIQIMDSWTKVAKDFMNKPEYWADLEKPNDWMDAELNNILGNSPNSIDAAKKLYYYLRNNFTCINKSGMFFTSTLKNTFKVKSGTVADLNLLLIAFLKHRKIESYPLILSTRPHGVTNTAYPLLDRYNYLACYVIVDGKKIVLDASVPGLAFGKLDLNCYNGQARVMSSEPFSMNLSADSLLEKNTNMVICFIDKDELQGRVVSTSGYYESAEQRKFLHEKGKSAFADQLKAGFGADYMVSNIEIDSLEVVEQPISVTYDFSTKLSEDGMLYFSPILIPFYKENPFAALTRQYPVEMPYRIDETYILNFELPANYQVEETPKSVKIQLNNTEGFFEYLLSATDGRVQIRSRLMLNQANFLPDDYDSLREFFSYIVQKQSEQIVLKKK